MTRANPCFNLPVTALPSPTPSSRPRHFTHQPASANSQRHPYHTTPSVIPIPHYLPFHTPQPPHCPFIPPPLHTHIRFLPSTFSPPPNIQVFSTALHFHPTPQPPQHPLILPLHPLSLPPKYPTPNFPPLPHVFFPLLPPSPVTPISTPQQLFPPSPPPFTLGRASSDPRRLPGSGGRDGLSKPNPPVMLYNDLA